MNLSTFYLEYLVTLKGFLLHTEVGYKILYLCQLQLQRILLNCC